MSQQILHKPLEPFAEFQIYQRKFIVGAAEWTSMLHWVNVSPNCSYPLVILRRSEELKITSTVGIFQYSRPLAIGGGSIHGGYHTNDSPIVTV